MRPTWKVRPHDPAAVAALSRGANLPPLVAHLLLNRGISDPATARAFLDARRDGLHDPALLPGAAEAADRLVAAIRDGRKIVVYGDYDVDGVCGTALLWACLRLAGAKDVDYYIPHRVDEGYGLNADALRTIAGPMGGRVVVTVDCGITAVAEARLARSIGLELIITDHHTPGNDLPEAAALVHPGLPGSSYPFRGLCGAGVAFKLAWQVCKGFGDGKKASPHLRDYLVDALGLVALATVADCVPLADENRSFVRHGLRGIALPQAPPGVQALLEVSKLQGKKLSSGAIGFQIGPRINAAGRLDAASKAVRMLTTRDPAEAIALATELDEHNARRQEIQRATVEEAKALLEESGGLGDRGAIVLGRRGWHPGVIGIVASRLAEDYHRPAVVVALGDAHGQGSARTIAGLNLYEAIHACRDALLSFGGHAAAAGLKVAPDGLPAFAERFDHHCRGLLTETVRTKSLHIDAEVPLASLTAQVVEQIDRLEPYGVENPRPVLVANQVRLAGDPKIMGERKDHVRLRLAQGPATVGAVGWGMAARLGTLKAGTVCAIAFEPSINEWNGRRDVQLSIKDLTLESDGRDARSA